MFGRRVAGQRVIAVVPMQRCMCTGVMVEIAVVPMHMLMRLCMFMY